MVDAPLRTLPAFLARAAAEAPDRELVVFDDRVLTYAEVERESRRVAAAFTRLGVGHGDHVAFLVGNSPEFLIAWFALARLGAVLVAVNTRFKAEEAGYVVDHCRARLLVTDDECADVAEAVADALPRVETVVTTGVDPRFASLAALPDDGEAPEVDVEEDDVVSLIYTSGTTGRPKGVMQTHRNFVLTGEAYASWLRISSDDRTYVCLPLFHVNSQAYSTMGVIAARATMVLAPRFSASRFWDDIARHRVTMFNFMGAMLVILSKGEPPPDEVRRRLRVLYSGSLSTLSAEQWAELEERYGAKLMTGFGMSETTFGLALPWDATPRPGSIGVPRGHPDPTLPPSEARVVREDGSDADPREVGELLLRNAAMMKGYFRDPERTAEVLVDGWLHTGDLVTTDEDGWFYFVDRKKDVIRRRGENVSSQEVERVLNAHPGVRLSGVVGVPSEMMDEDVLAFVVPAGHPPPEPAELCAWVGDRLADFKVPRYVEFVDDLPRTSTQKVAKPELRALSKNGGGRRWDREASR